MILGISNIPVTNYAAANLNTCRGVVHDPELEHLTQTFIVELLHDQDVRQARGLPQSEDDRATTPAVSLTFALPTILITMGWKIVKIKQYIPRPQRCFKRQHYGHRYTRCPANHPVCSRCPAHGHLSYFDTD